MARKVIESTVEQAVLDWLTKLGYSVAYGKEIESVSENPLSLSIPLWDN